MSFININWYIALAFCLFFFIGGRQLAEVPGGTPHTRKVAGMILCAFAAPALLFPLAYMPGGIAAMPWYNTFRTINRIELLSTLIAPAAGYATYLKPASQIKGYKTASNPIISAIKPIAFPICLLFISLNFIRPLLKPLDKETKFDDVWVDSVVLMQSAEQTGGPAALISAMNSLNNYTGSEYNATKGTYTDGGGTEFWYLARYAMHSGYRVKFFRPYGIENAPVPSVIPLSGAGGYIALLKRSEAGILEIGDPLAGKMILTTAEFISIYGDPNLVLALSVPKNR